MIYYAIFHVIYRIYSLIINFLYLFTLNKKVKRIIVQFYEIIFINNICLGYNLRVMSKYLK